MNVILDYSDATTIIVKGEIPSEEISKKLDEMVRKNAGKISIPGFRPGKAPKSVIVARYGDAFKNDLTMDLIREVVEEAIEREPALKKPLFMDEPKFEPISDGKPFNVEIYVEMKPKIELQKYKDFELIRPLIPVPDEEVDVMIEDFLLRNATLEPQERPVLENDYVEVKLSENNAEPVPIMLPLDDPEFLKYFGDLIGKSIGDTVEKDMSFPDSFPDRRLQGKKGHFAMEITNVFMQIKPELNAEFFKKIGKPDGYSVEDFRKEVSDYARAQKAQASNDIVFENLVDALLEANPVQIPKKFKKQQVDEYIEENVDISKTPPDKLEEIRKEVAPKIERRISYKFVVDAIADVESIEPSEQDVLDSMRNWAYSIGLNPEDVQKTITNDPQRYDDFKQTVRREKTIDFLLSTCKILDETISNDNDESGAPIPDSAVESEVNNDEGELQTS